MSDTQIIELRARHRLIDQLLKDGIEVALPLRDNGIDLIAYTREPKFTAFPIQMKASSGKAYAFPSKVSRDIASSFVTCRASQWHKF